MKENAITIKYLFKLFGLLTLSLVFLFLLINLIQFFNIFVAYKKVNNDISIVKESIKAKDISKLIDNSKSLNKNLKLLKYEIGNVRIIDYLPVVGENITAIHDLTDIGVKLTNILIILEPVEKANSDLIDSYKNGTLSFSDVKTKERVLKIISENKNIFTDLEKDINQIFVLSQKNMNAKNLIFEVQEAWSLISENYATIELVKEYLPIIKNAPELLGYNKSSRYLLLFQNNTELRPTGGFIGTYGILDLKNGDVSELVTDNIYNLDRASVNRVKVEPPKPLKDYLRITGLFLRDSNFDPDYKVSAKVAESFYKRESLDKTYISGVIAITPEVLKGVIEYLGDVTVMGKTYTADNFVELLNYETKFGYWSSGIKEADRKIVIQKISDIIFEKIKNLDMSGYKDIYDLVVKNLAEKQALLYFNNEDVQSFVEKKQWAGLIDQTENSDYVSVIDANLLAGKADAYVYRDIDYVVKNNSEETISTLSVKYAYYPDDESIYKDDAQFSDFYRTYTRIYVPEGSWLVSVKKDGEKIDNKNVDFKVENNKTSFGMYLVIPKNSTVTYIFEYQLTEKLSNQLSNKYSFVFQKQPGIIGNNINLNFNLDYRIKGFNLNNDNLESVALDDTLNINGYNTRDIKLDISY